MNRRTLLLGASALGLAAFAGGAYVLNQRRAVEAEAVAAATPAAEADLLIRAHSPVLGPADAKVTLMRADWTRRDADITAALAKLGRNGVPVYVLHRPGKEPLLLPEILTAGLVRDALATLQPQ